MPLKANVARSGAILLGEFIACDGFEPRREVGIITHAHSDHTAGLREALTSYKHVLMTEATKDLIEVLEGPLGVSILTLKYGLPFPYKGNLIILQPANHIVGSAQVLVEDEDGFRASYSSDFRLPVAQIIEVDVLVLDATYGNPRCIRPPLNEVYEALVKLVIQGLREGAVHVYGFHGKLQEAMEVLRRAGVKAPFIATRRVYEVTQVCLKHGVKVGEVLRYGTDEANEAMKGGGYVLFNHTSRGLIDGGNTTHITLTGWLFNATHKVIGDRKYHVALSDHADFNQLLAYVEAVKPKLVITDNKRIGSATLLAREIRRRLGITAYPAPP